MNGRPGPWDFILQTEVVLVWLVFSLLFGILSALSYGYLVYLALPLWLISGAMFFKYGFVIIEYSARGHSRLPRLGSEILGPEPRIYRQALVLAGALGIISVTPEPWRPLIIGLLLVVTPAITAFITFHWRLTQALRPDHIWQFMRGMGLTYYPLRFLITGSLMVVLIMVEDDAHLSELFPGGRFALAAIATLLLMATFRTTGVLLHSRRESIGIITDFSEEQFAAATTASRRKDQEHFIRDLALLSRRGRVAEAVERMESRLRRGRYQEDGDFYELLRELTDPALSYRMAEGYVGRLLDHSVTTAWDIFETLWSESGGRLRLTSGTRAIDLGRAASSRSQKQASVAMLGRFDSDYPRHPGTSEALLIGADLACQLGDLATASDILSRVGQQTGAIDAEVYQRCLRVLRDSGI
ncbi:MAG: hypothetical protein O2780_14355 [Proteobacteria bacterium]|nr:hypothetical protein [Pseudomonadota bacterium]MDA1299795.1 hypothetical protein [Pseudomonadota bacterium]